VKVAPTSVNPVDWKHRRGFLKEMIPLRLPAILGHDVAGEVAEAGKDVTNFKPGDRVMGLINDSYAEFVTEKAANLARVPEGLDLEQAGVLPLVLLTGAQLIERGVQPHAGDTVLVTGALGGVGRSAVYTAKQRGARVVAGVRGLWRSATSPRTLLRWNPWMPSRTRLAAACKVASPVYWPPWCFYRPTASALVFVS
jgi:NADPH:quinone reductase-like Zn-dependent oxidoreductase